MSAADVVAKPVVQPTRSLAEAFELQFPALRDRLVGICHSLVGDDAEDVVHDVYLIGRSRIGQLRRGDLMGPWLAKIAVRQCFQHHRRRRVFEALRPRLITRATTPPDPDLRSLVQSLPFRERTVVVLHYGHGLTLEEIAGLLNLKSATVRSVLFRARKRLRVGLEIGP